MNIYIQQIINIALPNKYTKWYVNIIERALKNNRNLEYSEKHHIVPESFFKDRKRLGIKGTLNGNPNHPDNLVTLTAKEHIFCHIFLTRMIKNQKDKMKMVSAVNWMLKSKNGNYQISPRTYAYLREQISGSNPMKFKEIVSKGQATKIERHGTKGFNNIKKTLKTKKEFYDDEHYNNRDQAKITCLEKYGYDHVAKIPENREKMKLTKLEIYGDENYNNRDKAKLTLIEKYGANPLQSPIIREKSKQTLLNNYGVDNISKIKVTCPHCGKVGGKTGMSTTHFDKCKQNPNYVIEIIICPHCNKQGDKNSSSFKRWHMNNCRLKD